MTGRFPERAVMPNGWTRFLSGDVYSNTLYLPLMIFSNLNTWLSQANHIFRRLRIISDFEDYAYTEAYDSKYPPTLACDDSDLDIENESSHYQQNVHDPVGRNGESEQRAMSNCKDHDASESTVEDDIVVEEMPVPGLTFKIVLYIQLVPILFLALSWVYNHVPGSFV
ncbi:hypothetical protein MSAN_02452900 [Mycena sanguinolenta]|uniref:Uncharacterized protein n=1 Tax=Mycena sanguinolenta TaxID=230812 RepID=A0A8H6WXV6_9AGAR|nr:hypothetical protein MSAN_02452900 [Mycena sanguinolenta]